MNFSVRVTHNTTVYDSRAAAAIFRAALRAHGMPSRRYQLELVGGVHARTKDGHSLSAWGRAIEHGSWVAMFCPESMYAAGADENGLRHFVRWLWTFDHEVLHLKGLGHGDMRWHDARVYDPRQVAPAPRGPGARPGEARGGEGEPMRGARNLTCGGPGDAIDGFCRKPARYRDGLCDGHHKQRLRGQELRPLRDGRREVVAGGLRVSRRCAERLRDVARAQATSVYVVVRRVLERWANPS